ncbi:MAG: Hsp70 family protein, partial [Lentisphaeria bacterium]|nr:Hsp70 family protein [Lentisphaeria bacterium]
STAADNQPSVDIHVFQGEREMVADNKRIGNFRLDGIAPAPRGVPQIEVTFDIDANGILHVTAKDLGTGKMQNITITASSGLSDSEIERMVNEAKAHEADDKAAKDRVETKNRSEAMVYQTEKQLNELGDKVPAELKEPVTAGVEKLKKAIAADDTSAMKAAMQELEQSLMKIGEAVYQAQQAQQAQQGQPGQQPPQGNPPPENKGDDFVDAEVVDDK